ncbi:MAG: DNA repair protein RadA [Gammaproteobacteria bacterium]|nr:DNA repair protein RadA [Gammaproteobacteria bacterium]NNF60312.1 DNA repair protein RadA [Gammaproteobacteria bacterium]NNM20420.1 DNA repair protein RadA [Gammaproteobacteria bacterium]
MAKAKIVFVCESCGARSLQWQGQCDDCGAWNSLSEQRRGPGPRAESAAPVRGAQRLDHISERPEQRINVGLSELDRVLGGGLVPGSVTLIGGDPGIGKSTLLLQAAARLSSDVPVLYVTGEESLRQLSLRARRLEVHHAGVDVLAETLVEQVVASAAQAKSGVVVIDSIQTMTSDALSSAAGTVSQVRESAAQLVRLAKTHGIAVILVGHVTKEGNIAGPRVLEHMVDTVLYFESDAGSRLRLIRAVKNRFGAANEIGVFAMTGEGLREVPNPSAIFISRQDQAVAGSVVMVAREGTRPLLVEVQALVDDSQSGHVRRLSVGLEQNRLALLLAVAHRHGGVSMAGQDVFLNVVGGVRIGETAADLPALLAAASSLRDRPVARGLVSFGEVGLAGEIRPVPFGEERLAEAAKHGFEKAIVPVANVPRRRIEGLEVLGVQRVAEALHAID